MDALTTIIAFMAAIVAAWIGYFLGNFFPVFGKAKEIKEANKAAGRSMADLSPLKQSSRRVMDWLLEREGGTADPADGEDVEGFDPDAYQQAEAVTDIDAIPVTSEITGDQALLEAVPSDKLDGLGDDALVVWHDRRKKKILARIKKEIIDLDDELSPTQHGAMSMLLVDLQERIGLSATLREAIVQETDKVFADKERKRVVPQKVEEVKPPSFNPLRTIVNYVQADASRIEGKPGSIPDQINVILQQVIKGTPLAQRGISMAEWPNRGAVFIVGIEVYEDIHKIPDSEVRTAIRTAVKRWEETQEDN